MERNCTKSYIFRRIQAACDNHSGVEVCEIRRFLDGHKLLLPIVNGMELCKNLCFSKGYVTLVSCDNHKRLKFHNGHGSLVTIVSGTEIVKPNAPSEDTDYRVYLY